MPELASACAAQVDMRGLYVCKARAIGWHAMGLRGIMLDTETPQ